MRVTANRTHHQTTPTLRPDTLHTYSRGIDWIAVERAANGTLPNPATALNDRERRAAWRLLLTARTPRAEVARLTGATDKEVREWANTNGFPPLTTNRRTSP